MMRNQRRGEGGDDSMLKIGTIYKPYTALPVVMKNKRAEELTALIHSPE